MAFGPIPQVAFYSGALPLATMNTGLRPERVSGFLYLTARLSRPSHPLERRMPSNKTTHVAGRNKVPGTTRLTASLVADRRLP